ncbi:PH domain protein [Talaromyces stipitatus ATCC 10500]|uniref:PH domain protein n=1 Tax=Talaromyces stipitatus (strain ATCC 10500 / CBS 375.48 / QM 6759 / NRRL 1006) TaxID=441959 RepID=B8MH44_TALSN|nr:PH domain protein [Talaromyces stipitatus ATCC 10500]EED16858.1 PH domain protein [Talaromyces stipitatus ATCC 10500]
MVRSRVRSFIAAFGSKNESNTKESQSSSGSNSSSQSKLAKPHATPPTSSPPNGLHIVKTRAAAPERASLARPASMVFTYQPPVTEIAQDTLPELLPIFTFMNSHSNKMYQEGYFLKLNDLDTQGRPCADRKWVECFGVLTGTVLSIWDAAALDAAGENQDVTPTFINLTDASIKMLETLPTYDKNAKPLQNILSVSTAGRNRYLFHFNSFHSLTQWTAGIRLALFEHTSLLEAYTGSIIAGKGRQLNNIRMIMERSRYKYEDWARVRFGAGTPWRRCWFVVTPPSDKDIQKLHKSGKKRSAYDRTTPILTGDIKFYETRKTKKAQPIATITDAYAAFAIYPQSNALIDQSTLIKIEGNIMFHSQPQSSTEGYIFIMPELHPAVSGLEIMLRFLFPVFDTFGLYGRPSRLIADTNNVKSLMFAFPKHQPYGYLDVLDVVNLINKSGSQGWSEKEWRRELREATGQRMSTVNSPASSISAGRPRQRGSILGRHGKTRFKEPPLSSGFNQSAEAIIETPPSTAESPVTESGSSSPYGHYRAVSDTTAFLPSSSTGRSFAPSRLSIQDTPPEPPVHGVDPTATHDRPSTRHSNGSGSDGDAQLHDVPRTDNLAQEFRSSPPAPVAVPPAFSHQPGEVPSSRPQASSELRRANNRMSSSTLAQLADVSKLRGVTTTISDIQENPYSDERYDSDSPVHMDARSSHTNAHPVEEQAPPVPVHGTTTDTRIQQSLPQRTSQTTPNLHLDTSQTIKRKPLPPQHSYISEMDSQEPSSASTDPTLRDLQHTVDEAALSRILPMQPSYTYERTVAQLPQLSRVDTESVYDDDGSVTPDYASRKSTETKRSEVSIPRPRMGVLKTVGGSSLDKQEVTIGDAHYLANQEVPKENPDIPVIDFGPTMAHNLHTRRPSMSDVLNNFGSNSPSPTRRDDRVEGHARKLSRSPAGDEKRRSVVWQPGLANYRPESPASRTVTPEQFVHHRSTSNSHPLDYPIGSPAARPRSGDWTLGASQPFYGRDLPPRPNSRGSTMLLNQTEIPARPHSRNSTMILNQHDMPIRPHSRNSTMLLNQSDLPPRPHSWGSNAILNQTDLSSHLSAREQEHVARMTGSAFFNLSNSNVKPAVSPAGLIGAIDARERERRYMKEGLSNQMVQQAIAQRQQQQMYEAQQMQQSQVGSVYNMPGASYTWDTLNQNTFNQPQMIPRPATSSDWHTWNGQVVPQTPPAAPPQHQNQYFHQQQYQQY